MNDRLEDTATIDDLGEDEPSIHRHDIDVVSLSFGVIFGTLGLVFLIGNVDASDVSATWGWVGSLGALGVLLVALGIRLQRR